MKKRKKKNRRRHSSASPLKQLRKRLKQAWRHHKWKTIILGVIVLFLLPATYCSISSLIAGGIRSGRFTVVSGDYNGIDVSKYQGQIDWSAVAGDPKIQFVYIKATEGTTITDPRYATNIKEARRTGLLVGSYHFFRANKSGRAQFEHFRRHADRLKQDIIPMVDVEDASICGASPAQVRQRLDEFMQLAKQEYGRYPLLYCQHSIYRDYLHPDFGRYYLFVAHYGSSSVPRLPGTVKCNIWQYSEAGHVQGIKGKVDLDRFVNGTTIDDIKL